MINIIDVSTDGKPGPFTKNNGAFVTNLLMKELFRLQPDFSSAAPILKCFRLFLRNRKVRKFYANDLIGILNNILCDDNSTEDLVVAAARCLRNIFIEKTITIEFGGNEFAVLNNVAIKFENSVNVLIQVYVCFANIIAAVDGRNQYAALFVPRAVGVLGVHGSSPALAAAAATCTWNFCRKNGYLRQQYIHVLLPELCKSLSNNGKDQKACRAICGCMWDLCNFDESGVSERESARIIPVAVSLLEVHIADPRTFEIIAMLLITLFHINYNLCKVLGPQAIKQAKAFLEEHNSENKDSFPNTKKLLQKVTEDLEGGSDDETDKFTDDELAGGGAVAPIVGIPMGCVPISQPAVESNIPACRAMEAQENDDNSDSDVYSEFDEQESDGRRLQSDDISIASGPEEGSNDEQESEEAEPRPEEHIVLPPPAIAQEEFVPQQQARTVLPPPIELETETPEEEEEKEEEELQEETEEPKENQNEEKESSEESSEKSEESEESEEKETVTLLPPPIKVETFEQEEEIQEEENEEVNKGEIEEESEEGNEAPEIQEEEQKEEQEEYQEQSEEQEEQEQEEIVPPPPPMESNNAQQEEENQSEEEEHLLPPPADQPIEEVEEETSTDLKNDSSQSEENEEE